MLKVTLYILAGLVLVLGLVPSISLIASAENAVSSFLMPVQMLGGGAIFSMIAPMLSGLLINLGIAMLIATIILSALLFAVARLLGRIMLLEARLANVEASFKGRIHNYSQIILDLTARFLLEDLFAGLRISIERMLKEE